MRCVQGTRTAEISRASLGQKCATQVRGLKGLATHLYLTEMYPGLT